jgi:hypothetical protein
MRELVRVRLNVLDVILPTEGWLVEVGFAGLASGGIKFWVLICCAWTSDTLMTLRGYLEA